jgi:hypothetical protein
MPPLPAKPSTTDRQRWYLWRSEKSIEEIAARERVKPETVRKSIDAVEVYRLSGSYEEVDAAWNHMALELVDEQKSVLLGAMVAETWITLPDGTRESIADHATRLKAIEVVKDLAVVSRPKAPMNQVNVQTNVANGLNGSSGGMNFEQRLREIKARRMAELVTAPATTPMLEAETTSQAESIAAELEDAGIDLEEGDIEEIGDDGE